MSDEIIEEVVTETVSQGWFRFRNLMTGEGFTGGPFQAEWYFAWGMLALLVILGMLFKKWLGEEEVTGHPYNFVWGFIGGLAPYIFIVSFTGFYKIAFIAGLIGMIGVGMFMSQYGE
jgi:hypothetical protein